MSCFITSGIDGEKEIVCNEWTARTSQILRIYFTGKRSSVLCFSSSYFLYVVNHFAQGSKATTTTTTPRTTPSKKWIYISFTSEICDCLDLFGSPMTLKTCLSEICNDTPCEQSLFYLFLLYLLLHGRKGSACRVATTEFDSKWKFEKIAVVVHVS